MLYDGILRRFQWNSVEKIVLSLHLGEKVISRHDDHVCNFGAEIRFSYGFPRYYGIFIYKPVSQSAALI